MPVSPQDFELYSRMTGTPMPTDAMSRMQMAPEVFKFTKDFAKKPNILEKTGNLIKTVGKIGLMGLGEGYRQSQANEQRAIEEQLRNKAAKTQSAAVTMDDPTEEVEDVPVSEKDLQRMANTGVQQTNLNPVEMDDYQSLLNPTTADSYGQDYVPNQTATNVVDRKMEQGSQIADSTPNIAEVLSESQDSQPSEKMVGVADKEFIAKFRKKNNLDKALKGVFKLGQQEEELIDDSTIVQSASPLNDHVDTEPGENAGNVPSNKFNQVSGTNTSSTEDISGFHKEMRKMEALERMAEQSPSTKQIALNEMNKSREGFMAQDGPNKPAYDAKQRILKKTAEKRKQIENTKGPSIVFMNAGSGESKEVPISDINSVEDVKNMTKEVMSPSVNQKSDDFMAKFVEGAKSDIVRGARSKKSLGITRIPATNGDAQVGFVLADKAVPEMPKNVPLDSPLRDETGALRNPYGGAKYSTTYGFGVAPGAEDMLQNQITDKDSFSNYMRRGLGEAKEGKRRKAGEIFEFLPPSARIVSGTARLGDIVM